MSYPKSPGFQSHSATSKEAAERLTSADTMRNAILEDIRLHGEQGRTGDELSDHFSTAPGTISARLISLENDTYIVKTAMTRATRSNRKAFVYVAHEYWKEESMGNGSGKQSDRGEVVADLRTVCRYIQHCHVNKQLPTFDMFIHCTEILKKY